MVWLFKSVMVISLEWPHVRVVTVMILSSVCMVLRISRVGDPFASVVSISVISSQLNVDKRSFVVCGSPVFCVMRGFLMRPSPVGVVQTNFMGWFETWVDIASSGFVCLAHSMGFSGSVPERFFIELNILKAACLHFHNHKVCPAAAKKRSIYFGNPEIWRSNKFKKSKCPECKSRVPKSPAGS